MKRMKIILCSLLCISLAGCNKSTVPTLAIESLTLEYGEDLFEEAKLVDVLENYDDIKEQYQFSSSLVSDETKKITADNISDDEILAVGEYTLIIDYADDEEPLRLPVEIKDTIAPEFTNFEDELSIDYGFSKDLASLFSATDLAETKISIDGNVNTMKAGSYEVKVIAEDASGNKNEKNCTITVKKKPQTANSSPSGNSSITSYGSLTSKSSDTSDDSFSSSSGPNVKGNGSSPSGNDQSCVVPNGQIGNSKKIFDTKNEAYEYGETEQLNHESSIRRYFVIEVYDTCNNFIGWTVDFEYR